MLRQIGIPPRAGVAVARRPIILAVMAALALAAMMPLATHAQTPPAVTSVAPGGGPVAGGTSVTITGTSFTAANAVSFGSTAAATFEVDSDTQITATSPAGSAGQVDVTVTTPDGTSPTSGSDTFTYVAQPVVSSVVPNSGPTAGGTSVTITGANFTGASVRFGSTAAAAFTVNTDSQITATSPAGTGSVHITVSTAGGTSATSAADQFTYAPMPAVSSVAPGVGSTAGGTSVTIQGTNFTGATLVHFGSASATFTLNSDTRITATSPASSAGSVDVTVTTASGTSATSGSDTFTYVASPAVSSVTPNRGPAAGGTSVTIAGANFTGATAVHFGTATATFTVNSDTQITATSPAGSGLVHVTVTTPGGSSSSSAADQFTYAGPPAVSSVAPSSGPTAGGTSVTITGANFTGASAVSFGSSTAVTFTVNSDTQITATSPAGTGSVHVTVMTAGGTSASSSADLFTYAGAPTVSSVTPSSGPTAGGTSVTITGANFTGATAVHFGSATPPFTVVSDTKITTTSPASAAGVVDVTVTTAGGTSAITAADQFTYASAPGAPTAVVAGPGDLSAGVSWTAPSSSGSSPITSYTVTSSPGGFTATTPDGATTYAVVPGLTNGTSYMFTVVANNSFGASAPSAQSNAAVPGPATVTSVYPTSCPWDGCMGVAITGTNLAGATSVQFGPNPGTNLAHVDPAHITVYAPHGSGVVDVRVSSGSAITPIVPADKFTYTTNCLTGATVTADNQSPQPVGTLITFTTTPVGCPSPVFTYWLRYPNGNWVNVRPWAPSPVWRWTPSATGTYTLHVGVNESGDSLKTFESLAIATYVVGKATTGSPCTAATLNPPDKPSPQQSGTIITFTANATPCINPEFKFYVQATGGPWILGKNWGTNTYVWNTAGNGVTSYNVDVWVRAKGSTAAYQAYALTSFTLNPPQACTAATLTPNPGSPQPTGTVVTFTATASTCSQPLYKFYVKAVGGTWILGRDWGIGPYNWITKGDARTTYSVVVWVRQNGSKAAQESYMLITYTLS